ncbi:Auxin response factor 3 [Sesamum angolense]|uniref:Auxin response factor 3 n=1 Tax=Sesamum angolense TaxID=2727404 RepID=A0AAE2BVA7_9LAMI|nr:Auxin response factor 3 [Sesamum angolense]
MWKLGSEQVEENGTRHSKHLGVVISIRVRRMGSSMMCGLIDLNTVNNEDDAASLSCSPSSSAASGSFEFAATSSMSVCMELWHACAGPLISLPKKGSAVVYFPQGHVEHLPEHPAVAYDLPPHVFCRVVDVKLHADVASDEVYAQVSLVPDQQG